MFNRSFSSFVKPKTCDGKSWAAAKRFAANVITVSHQSRLWRKLPNTASQRNKDTEWTLKLLTKYNSFINLTAWVYRDDYRLFRYTKGPREILQWRYEGYYFPCISKSLIIYLLQKANEFQNISVYHEWRLNITSWSECTFWYFKYEWPPPFSE